MFKDTNRATIDSTSNVNQVNKLIVTNERTNLIFTYLQLDPFPAVKCNNDPVLLRILINLGVNFDCASM
ncbi:hypothetical protein TrispH2_011795, partial [Trichoplax sp. H2]